jgi:hypothetical protein
MATMRARAAPSSSERPAVRRSLSSRRRAFDCCNPGLTASRFPESARRTPGSDWNDRVSLPPCLHGRPRVQVPRSEASSLRSQEV